MQTHQISELCEVLETVAPLHLQEAYDNCGLLTGRPEWEITGVLCSLDCTEEVLIEAQERSCNVVVCHHPVIFKGLKSLTGEDYVQRTIISAIQKKIAIYAIHTNLDNVLKSGVNQKIAQKIGLSDIQILSPKQANVDYIGAGIIGRFQKPVILFDFLKHLKLQFQTGTIKYTKDLGKEIRTVAVCGGSGSFLTKEAIRQSADVLVSSDFKYHDFFDADGKIVLIDIGHYESEQFTIELLKELVSEKFTNFAAHSTKINTNPIKYF
ncbi:MAG: Nif3-like dinuclear metal center hexameric protein [Saprospiraceae bacterium]|nr:Nif3-like dinuclear metal center hexameric protein [Saprospiraceae bacterium]MBK9630115.1 Nif3-like dinuclear metal center hexameric protein [Saprospiraceae bacterium]